MKAIFAKALAKGYYIIESFCDDMVDSCVKEYKKLKRKKKTKRS